MSGTIEWGNNGKDNSDRPDFLGRNGTGYCDGVAVYEHDWKECLNIAPITSKGVIGRCSIDIPVSCVPDVVLALMPGLEELLKAAEKLLPALATSKDPAMRALAERRLKA